MNAIADTVQTALTNNYLRKTSGNVVNADINASAAIAYSKLSLANSIVTGDIFNGTILDADINAAAGISKTKLAALNIANADVIPAAAITPSKMSVSPYCVAYRGLGAGAQVFGSATGQVSFTAGIQTVGAMFSGGTPTRITVPYTGWYRVYASAIASLSNTSTSDRWLLQQNGITTLANGLGGFTPCTISGELGAFSLTAADYLELWFFRSTGTSITTAQPAAQGGIAGILNPSSNPDHWGALLVQYLGT